MAKHANDPGTIDAFPAKRGRGRPPTGKAMSDAERARLYRARQRDAGISVTQKTITQKVGATQSKEHARLVAKVARLELDLRNLRSADEDWCAWRKRVEDATYDAWCSAKRIVPASGPVKREAADAVVAILRDLVQLVQDG
ncbi:hypothetical protein FHW84_003545 [Dyella sp. SG562]|uniref:hypothetical protein n=1 Tax=Dyella sp. SG562 TaxID=2587017 RepID=UPI0014214D5E|nr:hypothetical protein [Dyella sp. SG562]NII74948.1 hypothetical protein [Dyella sp. SG562]